MTHVAGHRLKRSAIPNIPHNHDPQTREILLALKENMELLTGRRGDKLTAVPDSASLADVIVALNEVIDRLS